MVESTKADRNPDEIEVTPEMIEAGREAIEDYAFSSVEGYDLERALPAVFKAMIRRRKESHRIA